MRIPGPRSPYFGRQFSGAALIAWREMKRRYRASTRAVGDPAGLDRGQMVLRKP